MWDSYFSPYLTYDQALWAGGVIGVAVLIVLAAYLPSALHKLMGKYRMRKREKRIQALRDMLGPEAMELLEDHLTDVITNAVYAKRIDDDQARIIYSRLAYGTGLWGLHPRKFSPTKRPEDLEKLKEQLGARRTARETERKAIIDNMLATFVAEAG